MSFNLQTPRAANAKEIADWARVFPKLGSNFKILAPEQEEGSDGCYNCLGWASGEVKDFKDFNDFKEDKLAARCEESRLHNSSQCADFSFKSQSQSLAWSSAVKPKLLSTSGISPESSPPSTCQRRTLLPESGQASSAPTAL